MASHAVAQSVLWFDYGEPSRFFARMKRTLALSFGFHLLVLLAVMGLRLPQQGERPLASVEVSLVSMPAPPTAKPTEAPKPVEPPKRVEPVQVPESKPAPPTEAPKPVEPLKRVEPVQVQESKPVPPLKAEAPVPAPVVKTEAPTPVPLVVPPVATVKRDILRELELPPEAPQFGELSPTKAIGKPQQAAKPKIKLPDLPPVPDLVPEPVKKTPQRAAMTEDLNRELDEELKKIKQYQPAAKLEIPKETKPVETPIKPSPQQEAKVSPAKMPDTMLKIAGSAGTNPYWARVQSIINSHWEPPPIDMSGQTYTVILRFRLQRDGVIKDVAVQQTSGNEYYDMAGRRAILKPRVLPPFPSDMTDGYKDVEMLFRVGEAKG